MPGASLEAVTGRLGVGAIAFLGLFLMVDGLQVGAFELVETYGKSSTWGIVGVVLTAVVIYIIGVFCVGIAELGLSRFAVFDGPKPSGHPGRFFAPGPVCSSRCMLTIFGITSCSRERLCPL